MTIKVGEETYYSEEYVKELKEEIQRLNNQLEFIGEQNKYIDKLENIIDELEKYLKEDLKQQYRDCGHRNNIIREVYNKLNELKGDNK